MDYEVTAGILVLIKPYKESRTLWGERELCGLYVLHRQHNS